MATVKVSRPVIDEDNRLSWVLFDVDESELRPDEVPYVESTL